MSGIRRATSKSSAISAFDISGDIGRETFKPFVQRVQAIDKFIADNLLTEDQLGRVRARINQLQNPRWWGFDSESSAKDAIEKASKFFAAALHRDFRRDRHQHFRRRSAVLLAPAKSCSRTSARCWTV